MGVLGLCVRAGLSRHIRPAKCRPYLVNLLPCLEALASRSENALHETLALAFPNLFAVLGPHSNDNEVIPCKRWKLKVNPIDRGSIS